MTNPTMVRVGAVGALSCDIARGKLTGGGTSDRRTAVSRVVMPRVSLTLFVPGTYLSYISSRELWLPISNQRMQRVWEQIDPPEALNPLAITILVFVTNRRKRGYLEAVSTVG